MWLRNQNLHKQRRPVRAIARYWRRHACWFDFCWLLLVKKRSFRSCATREDLGQSSECKFLSTYAKSTKYDSEQGCFLLLRRKEKGEGERWRGERGEEEEKERELIGLENWGMPSCIASLTRHYIASFLSWHSLDALTLPRPFQPSSIDPSFLPSLALSTPWGSASRLNFSFIQHRLMIALVQHHVKYHCLRTSMTSVAPTSRCRFLHLLWPAHYSWNVNLLILSACFRYIYSLA